MDSHVKRYWHGRQKVLLLDLSKLLSNGMISNHEDHFGIDSESEVKAAYLPSPYIDTK